MARKNAFYAQSGGVTAVINARLAVPEGTRGELVSDQALALSWEEQPDAPS